MSSATQHYRSSQSVIIPPVPTSSFSSASTPSTFTPTSASHTTTPTSSPILPHLTLSDHLQNILDFTSTLIASFIALAATVMLLYWGGIYILRKGLGVRRYEGLWGGGGGDKGEGEKKRGVGFVEVDEDREKKEKEKVEVEGTGLKGRVQDLKGMLGDMGAAAGAGSGSVKRGGSGSGRETPGSETASLHLGGDVDEVFK